MAKATIEEVREFIRHANAEELRLVSAIITSRYSHLQAELSQTFNPGDKVYFIKGKRNPQRIVGEVVHSDVKWVYLAVAGRMLTAGGWNWKVAPSLLKRIT